MHHIFKKHHTPRKHDLKCIVKLAYGIGHLLNDLCAAIWFTYVLIFYELVLKFTSFYAGLIILVGQIADALATPIVGVLCDRGATFWKIELRHRKLWYLVGTILVLVTFPFLFFKCLGCESAPMVAKFFYYVLFVIFFQIAWAFVQIAHLAVAPDLSPNERVRTTLMSLRNTSTVSANLFVYLMTYILLEVDDRKQDHTEPITHSKLSPVDITRFQAVVITSLIIGTISSIIFFIFVKENLQRIQDVDEHITEPTKYKELFCRIGLYQVAMIYMGTRIYCNVIQSLVPLYLNVALLMDKPTIASIPFVMYISGFMASLASAPINDIIGRKLTFLLGFLFATGASLWIRLDTSALYKQYFVYLVTIFLGLASSLLLVTSLAVANDYIGNDINNSAFLYGVLSFLDKMACGIVIMIIQSLKPCFGSMYYRDALAYVCFCSSGMGLISIITMKTVNEDVTASESMVVEKQEVSET